ncbi:DUF3081 domain-containing protein [Clostridium botulinum C]|uniref:hypothetical protein n=1 Tax=Clostridium botulinum TaxID=1491 RepID=UPI001E609089|nr:hypothetical protein [Clostridium botulinum]MCD3216902.1 DUF3081 domain-containing protein [Clostridium botulinum C]
MKVLTSGEQLEGKKIVYCGIEHMADIDGTMIITEDKEVLMFNGRGNEYDIQYRILKEEDIEKLILYKEDISIKRILLEYDVISEKDIADMQDKLDQRNQERNKRLEEDEYKKYLQLKEKFEVNNIPNN